MRYARAVAAAFAGALVAATAVTTVVPAAANGGPYPVFSIAKQNTGPATIVAGSGQKAEFTITVSYTLDEFTDVQPVLAPTTAFRDYLPFGLVIDTLPPECTADPFDSERTFDCTVDFTDGATSKSVTVTAVAPDWARPGTYTNCAFLAFDTAPEGAAQSPLDCAWSASAAFDDSGWVAGASVEVVNDADVRLAVSDPGQVDPGKTADITWTVTNAGPSAADLPLTLTSTLPTGVTFVSSDGSDPWQCTAVGQEVTCTYTLALDANGPQPACAPTQDVPVACDPLLPPGQPVPPLKWTVSTAKPGTVAKYEVPATVVSKSNDSKPANNTATATIKVTPVDLAIVKTAAGPVRIGDEVEWTVTASNVGTIDDAGTVTLTDTLPAGARFVSAQADGWTCEVSGQKVTCTRPGFAVGSSEIRVRTTMTERGEAKNTASISSVSYEQNTANNTTEKAVRVNRVAQTATALPKSPTRVKSGRTDQGQKLRTRVRCKPVKASAAGEVAFCTVSRRNGVVRVRVQGDRPVKVTVVQTAKGTATYKPFSQRKTYIVRP